MKRITSFLIIFLISFISFSQIQQLPSGTVYTNQPYSFTAPCLNCTLPNWEVVPSQPFLTDVGGFTMHISFQTTGSKTIRFKNGSNVVYQTTVNVVSGGGGNSGGSTTWTSDTYGINYSSGRVGIGMNSHSSYRLDVNGDIRANNGWIRSTGDYGFYNNSDGTYLFSDNANYWRTRSDRGIAIANRANVIKGYIYHDNASSFGLLDGDGHWGVQLVRDSYTSFRINNSEKLRILSNGKLQVSGNLIRTAHHTGHLEGSYNNIGENSTRSNPIYTIGSNYNPATSTLSNMYGVGYTHKNASFINSADLGAEPTHGWGAYIAADGNARVFFDASGGHGFFKGNLYNQNIYSRGTITASGGNSNNWNTAYSERGSQIAGTGLTWSNGKLNAAGINTDDQTIDVFSLSGTTLNLSLEGDGEVDQTVDLTSINTDDQTIDVFSLSGTTLSLSLEGDGQANQTVNLASINTDNQDLSISGNTLSLSNDPTPVDLAGYLDNTDNQDLSIAGDILSLTNDASPVDLSGYLDNTDNQSLSLVGNNLSISGGNTVDISSIDTDTQLSDADITAMGYIKTATDDQTAAEVNFTSTTGLTAADVNTALDEINGRINSNDGSRWTETSGNIAFTTGQVSIGTTTPKPNYEFSVAGKIVAEEVLIEFEGDWPDYVFSPSYDLLSILDLKKYIQKNNHLPNVPSAKDVGENGIEVGEMNKILLEKIEELTLYMIKQSEEIESLKSKVERLEAESK